jgi:hypothetical protein
MPLPIGLGMLPPESLGLPRLQQQPLRRPSEAAAAAVVAALALEEEEEELAVGGVVALTTELRRRSAVQATAAGCVRLAMTAACTSLLGMQFECLACFWVVGWSFG